MTDCPACIEESTIAALFPLIDLTGCRSGKVRTTDFELLCADHRVERLRLDSNDPAAIERQGGYARQLFPGYEIRWKDSGWQPIDVERVKDGFVARVTRMVGGHRWRWSVTPLEVAQRQRSQVVEHAHSRGHAGSYDRAVALAEAAIEALKKAKGGRGT